MEAQILMLKGLILQADAVSQYEHEKAKIMAIVREAKMKGEKSYIGLLLALAETIQEIEK